METQTAVTVVNEGMSVPVTTVVENLNPIFDLVARNREWLFSGIGVLFLLALWRMPSRLATFLNAWRNKTVCLRGVYQVYHVRVRNNSTDYVRSTMRIRWTWSLRLIVEVRSPRSKKMSGYIHRRRDVLFFVLHNKTKRLWNMWAVHSPQPGFNFMLGTLAGASHSGLPVACFIVARKTASYEFDTAPIGFMSHDNLPSEIVRVFSEQNGNMILVERPPVSKIEEL